MRFPPIPILEVLLKMAPEVSIEVVFRACVALEYSFLNVSLVDNATDRYPSNTGDARLSVESSDSDLTHSTPLAAF